MGQAVQGALGNGGQTGGMPGERHATYHICVCRTVDGDGERCTSFERHNLRHEGDVPLKETLGFEREIVIGAHGERARERGRGERVPQRADWRPTA